MAIVALVFYVVWAALAFGWRTVVQLRRTGDSGLRLHAEFGSAQFWAKIGFIIALVVGFVGPIAALSGLDNVRVLDGGWIQQVGVVVALVGIALTVVAQASMADSWRIGVDPAERTALVVHGAFAIVRNPIFSAMLVTAMGLTLMVPNVVSVTGLIALIAALEVQVRLVEEPYLRSVHGDEYRNYARRVGRFVPRLGR